MVFSSLPFIFVFIPIFFGCYYIVPKYMRNLVLLIGSLIFYFISAIHHPQHFIIFVISMIVDFEAAIYMESYPKYRKTIFVIAVLFHIISLFIFKYASFFLEEIASISGLGDLALNIVLPIGISFYTFQGISYLADVYRGKLEAEQSLLRYTVYISMFEQLIAGPIVTYPQVKKELHDRRINKQLVHKGLAIFIFGLGLKVLLANPLGKLWSQACAIGFESLSTPLAWLSIFAFSFQIYFDFFGYSLMAIGLGEMLGFHLPKNFDHPYISKTMTEFWRRWHITLGSWFREYVYIPLGGNRKGMIYTIRNLFIVWLLTGIWHGAGYHFMLWGLVLFIILLLEKYVFGSYLNKHAWLGHLYMFFLIPLTWAIFAIDDLQQLGVFFTRLFPFFGQGVWSIFRYDYLKYLQLYYPFFIAGFLFSTKLPYRLLQNIKRPMLIYTLLFVIFAASVYCLYRGLDDPFLYFRF